MLATLRRTPRECVRGPLCLLRRALQGRSRNTFLPKSLYPHLVYYWSNWLFFPVTIATTPRGRNGPNRGMWIRAPFQNVVARRSSFASTPRRGKFFRKDGLSPLQRRKAQNTIDDLGLNHRHHLKKRTDWVRMVSELFWSGPGKPHRDPRKSPRSFVITRCPFLQHRKGLVVRKMDTET